MKGKKLNTERGIVRKKNTLRGVVPEIIKTFVFYVLVFLYN